METALFRPVGVTHRDCLCDVLIKYASVQSLGFLDRTKNCSFPDGRV
ncbi:hypothetical protein OR1_01440 [Geobacter sp. OR-1]|nr:hypothetical protein OR1_01440 [Geobacter sp. OR-1]